jgi:hypothetical protein
MGKTGGLWQYHSRSDRHSKITCWAVLFDLLRLSPTLRKQAKVGAVGFGINHQMADFKADRRKDLDLVVCKPLPGWQGNGRKLSDLMARWGIDLSKEEKAELQGLPDLLECPVGAVEIALEAKACMTEHGKARPRLYDELHSSHLTIHGASPAAIASGFVMINAAERFQSPGRTEVTSHKQPKAFIDVMEKVKQLPRRSSTGESGYDSLAIVVVECVNDGVAPVSIFGGQPPADSIFSYGSALQRMAHLYDSRFPKA